MAIILRGNKGSALTHTELDNNFRQFFYSASYDGTSLSLFTTASLNNEINLPMSAPSGYDYYIQFKSGNAVSGANAVFSGSENLIYDFRENHLKHTGSFTNVGDGTFTGNVTIDGTLTAQTFNTELVSSSVIFESGSTQFGNSSDDTHTYTGSMRLQGDYTGSDINIRDWGSVSASLATLDDSIGATVSYSTLSNIPNAIVSSSTQINSLGIDYTTLSNTPNAIVSSSTQINSLGIDYTTLSNIPSTIVSGSSIASSAQGQVALTTNGVAATAVDLGLQTTDSPTFAGLTINGQLTATGDIIAYYSSDKRLKDNIEVIPDALNKVKQIRGVSWDWNDLTNLEGHDVGVIAQELEQVLPELVVERTNGFKAVRYEKIVALLIEAVKDQQSQIDELKSKL